MGEFTKRNHKSMVKLHNGETIFHRQIRLLSASGIEDFVITTGPFSAQLQAVTAGKEFNKLNFTFVHNPCYANTNYIYSMYLAREHFDDDALVMHGDLVFNRGLIEALLMDERFNLATVNEFAPLPDKDFKARVIDGYIREVSVSIFDENCYAFQPLYKLSKKSLVSWGREIEKFIVAEKKDVYAEEALNNIQDILGIKTFSYANYYINEIDTVDDLNEVTQNVRCYDYDAQPIFFGEKRLGVLPDILEAHNLK